MLFDISNDYPVPTWKTRHHLLHAMAPGWHNAGVKYVSIIASFTTRYLNKDYFFQYYVKWSSKRRDISYKII